MDRAPQVIVVGAGPTGLMLTLQLLRRGVSVRLIDRDAGPSSESRAAVIHARTLEFLQQLGLADAAVRRGRALSRLRIDQRGRIRAELPLSRVGLGQSPFPFVLALGQNETEALLLQAIESEGGRVERDCEVRGVEAHANLVRLSVARGAATTGPRSAESTIEAPWVCACDGASSTIRHALGVPFEGGSYEHRFFLADCRVDGPVPDDGVTICLERRGLAAFFGMAGDRRFRVIGKLPRDASSDRSMSFDAMAALARRTSALPLSLSAPRWSSVYRLHHRAVPRLRAGPGGRVILLGDAAHVHSPVGGQGMNTGLQDAANLAWKLALVVRGAASDALLETFDDERMPVIRRLLQTTDRFFSLATSEQPVIATLRGWLLGPLARAALGSESRRRRAFAAVSQIGIGYERGVLARAACDAGARTRGNAPRPGARLPHVTIPGEDGRPRSIIDLCRGAWFTAIVIGGSRNLVERAQAQAAARAMPESLLAWRHMPRSIATADACDALGAIDPSTGPVSVVGSERVTLLIVRPDLHCFGAWDLEDAPRALAALETSLRRSAAGHADTRGAFAGAPIGTPASAPVAARDLGRSG